MKVRTPFRSVAQLQDYIAEDLELRAEGLRDLKAGNIKPNRVLPFKRSLFDGMLHCALARYSLGCPLADLTGDIIQALEFLPDIWPDDGKTAQPDFLFDCYTQMLWLLTLAKALDLPNALFDIITKTWEQTGREDWLINVLIHRRQHDRCFSDKLLFSKPYSTLKSAALHPDKGVAAQLIKRYLEKEFYSGHSACYWHGTHQSKHNACFGYWSFEAAAIASYSAIPSASFADNPYFPADVFPLC